MNNISYRKIVYKYFLEVFRIGQIKKNTSFKFSKIIYIILI